MKKEVVLAVVLVGAFVSMGFAADVSLKWDGIDGADGYILEMSLDSGITWINPQDVGDVTQYTFIGVPNSGMVLFRNTAYNSLGQAVRYEAGAWYNGDWKPLDDPGLGVQ